VSSSYVQEFFRGLGRSDEWHVDFAKSLCHIEFDRFARLREAIVVLGSAFGHARLEAVGAIGDTVLGDGLQHLLIERFSGDGSQRGSVRARHWSGARIQLPGETKARPVRKFGPVGPDAAGS
jgi:hypothetical protein